MTEITYYQLHLIADAIAQAGRKAAAPYLVDNLDWTDYSKRVDTETRKAFLTICDILGIEKIDV